MNTLKFDPYRSAPDNVIAAARTIGQWAANNSLEYYQLGEICDRKFAYDIEELQRELEYERKLRLNAEDALVKLFDMKWKVK